MKTDSGVPVGLEMESCEPEGKGFCLNPEGGRIVFSCSSLLPEAFKNCLNQWSAFVGIQLLQGGHQLKML